MEEYLRDSPSEFMSGGSNRTPSSMNPSYKSTSTSNVNDDDSNNLMLNVGTNSLDTTYQFQNPIASNGDFLNTQYIDNQFIGDSGQLESFPEPFLDDFDTTGFQFDAANPGQQQNQPQLQNQSNFSQFTNTNNLDDIISPNLNSNLQLSNNNYLNPQYFSPNSNAHYGNLNSIPEDNFNLSPSVKQEPFSGPGSFNGPDILSGSHLSPQGMPYISSGNFDNSFDTLRSPQFSSGSYLNSPPQYQNIIHSLGVPIKEESLPGSNALSPPVQQHLISPSVDSAHLSARDSSTKQLTKEEKLKRRRDFHNQVERRRRDLIKEKIKTLGQIVPPSLLNPPLCAVQALQAKASTNSQEINDLISSVKVKETKPNKSTILNRSVDYIKHLNYVIEKQEQARSVLLQQIQDAQSTLNGSNIPTNTSSLNSINNLNAAQPSNDLNLTYQDAQLASQQEYFNPDEFFLAKEFY